MSRIIAILAVLILVGTAGAEEPEALRDARQIYASLKHPTENQRVAYVTKLVRLRESLTRNDGEVFNAIDAEVVKHPMPASAITPQLARRLVGRWQSPRHPYFYHADGTWASDDNTPQDTGGTWRMEGNQFYKNFRGDAPSSGETIILLTSKDFVYGIAPYYHRRGKAFPWGGR